MSDTFILKIRTIAETAKPIEMEARRAVEIDPNDSEAHSALGIAFISAGNLPGTLDCAERALRLNQNSALGHSQRAVSLMYSGRQAEARSEASVSLRLNPHGLISQYAATQFAGTYYLEGNYEAAIDAARRCLDTHPMYTPPRRYLVTALGQLGRREEAAEALRDWLAVAPGVFDNVVRNRPPYVLPEDHAHILEGMRKAGWTG